ncbi:MAG: FapA family protein [Chitinivibrionia bacterium]|nr:FapA family protein [Chitinivibrionia bacterium]
MAILDEIANIVESRDEDGKLYIMVYPETEKEPLIEKFTELYENVLGGDLELVKRVIKKASGSWECIGDIPIDYDRELDQLITVKTNPMKVYMGVSIDAKAKNLTVDKLLARLKIVGVVFGIKHNVLEDILVKQLYEQFHLVAEGVPPIEGYDGSLEMKVNTEKSSEPKKLEDGSVDYREISAFTTIFAGDIIGTQIPADHGTPGTDVLGNAVPPKPRKEFVMKPAQFISVSEDGKNLVADTTGVLINKAGLLSIKERLELKNVDYNTGNVRFPGAIDVEGNVAADFCVESESDIVIHGMVESATIKSKGGSVKISGGIIGKNNTFISAKTAISINFAQDTDFECIEGDVNVGNYMHHCNVICKNYKTLNEKSAVVGGKIEANESITVSNSSNEEGVATELTLYSQLEKELIAKRAKLEEVQKPLAELLKNSDYAYKNKTTAIKTFGYKEGSPQYNDYLASKKKYEEIKAKSELVENNLTAINAKLAEERQHTGHIAILKNGFAGTVIKIGRYKYYIKDNVFARKYYLEGAEIVGGPLIAVKTPEGKDGANEQASADRPDTITIQTKKQYGLKKGTED